eukprot:gnl/TRDRNA2_/TRDRNA2_197239_c0_seq1.p1 gnl/TRDRNA2_/TRDRNA2_197239_c0~~gnl/TRDRNA2_/TRDRNA2_197239_c0_seq1.p1  ORF type:complete len:347 (-),score=45.87 gnl/TRDRNA2_/TRDRNA2_197239_c0_seq1:49-1089(-)
MTSSGSTRVCVLGATGFIGRSAVAAFVERGGFQVRATARKLSDLPAELQLSGVEVAQADVTDPASLERALQDVDVVVNCTGIYRWWLRDDSEYVRVNADGAANIARACLANETVRRLVHISTVMAYGYPAEKPFRETSKPGPHASEYARTKHLGDVNIKELTQAQSKVTVVMLYLACVTGKGDTIAVGRPAAVYQDFMLGKIPMLVAPDTNYIYVHIRDVQSSIIAATTLPASKMAGQDYFIGNSKGMMTTRQYFELISKHTGRPCPTASLNLTVAYWLGWLLTWISTRLTGVAPVMPLDIMRTAKWGSIEFDCAKSEDELGISYTPIDEAVSEAVADVKQRMSSL